MTRTLPRTHSLIRNLTAGLLLTLCIIASIQLAVIHYITYKQTHDDLEKKGDAYIAEMADILSLPMWDLDQSRISAIGKSVFQNELVTDVRISQINGKNLFTRHGKDFKILTSLRKLITYKGEQLGYIELGLTAHYYDQLSDRFFIYYMLVVLLMVIVLSTISTSLLRHMLKRPFQEFIAMVQSYGNGDISAFESHTTYLEFDPLMTVLQQMGATINEQMQRLKLTQHTVDSSTTATFMMDMDGHISYVNDALCASLGYSREELLQSSLQDIAPRWADTRWKKNRHAIETAKTISFSTIHRRKDGSTFPVEITANYQTFQQHEFLVAFAVDVTERERAKENQRKLEQQLRHSQKIEAIGTLTGGIAHDFNNILAIISGNIELAAETLPETSSAAQCLNKSQIACTRGKELIRQMLNFSRESQPDQHVLDLVPLIQEANHLIRATIPTSIKIETQLAAETASIRGNATQISQIIVNLCINAYHAMVDHGTLIISLSKIDFSEDDVKQMHQIKKGPYAKLTISDTGCGIPKSIIDKIFDPYFTTKDVGKGAGMGLSVVYGIVNSHNGAISVYSEKDAGTSFHVYFPLLTDAQNISVHNDDSPKKPAPTIAPANILLVDDEEMLVSMGQGMLKLAGHHVTAYTHPLEALKAFKDNPKQFDIVITDATMPDLPGHKLIAEILAIRPEIPIILCTGHSEFVSRTTFKNIGITTYLEKPFTKNKLHTAVAEALQKS